MAISAEQYQRDWETYRRLRPMIEQTYEVGHFVAILDGQIVAHAATLDDLVRDLTSRSIDPKVPLTIQVGADYLDEAFILGAEGVLR